MNNLDPFVTTELWAKDGNLVFIIVWDLGKAIPSQITNCYKLSECQSPNRAAENHVHAVVRSRAIMILHAGAIAIHPETAKGFWSSVCPKWIAWLSPCPQAMIRLRVRTTEVPWPQRPTGLRLAWPFFVHVPGWWSSETTTVGWQLHQVECIWFKSPKPNIWMFHLDRRQKPTTEVVLIETAAHRGPKTVSEWPSCWSQCCRPTRHHRRWRAMSALSCPWQHRGSPQLHCTYLFFFCFGDNNCRLQNNAMSYAQLQHRQFASTRRLSTKTSATAAILHCFSYLYISVVKTNMCLYIQYTHTHKHHCTFLYLCMQIERERESERVSQCKTLQKSMC